jgi:hypothetical protein
MKSPILITGCARSGTSMVAGIVNLCGAFGGKMSGPNRNNEKGMFENAAIRQQIVKPYLRSIGADPLGQYPLPETKGMMVPSDWQERVETIMRKEGLQDNQLWMYKGAKMCLHWPVWAYAFPDAKWVIVRRKTPDIIRSCMRTGFMNAFAKQPHLDAVGAKDEWDGWLWWIHKHEERFVEMISAGLNVKQIWPERMVDRNYGQTQEMLEWLGLEWNDKIFDFIEPKLWKARQNV